MATYWSDMHWRRTAVYRFFDDEGVLLYVGLTCNIEGRFSKHRSREWWPDVADIDIAWFPNRMHAQGEERWAIRWENPLHNITGLIK